MANIDGESGFGMSPAAAGEFSVRAMLAAHDSKTVVLRRESDTLVALVKSKLLERDQSFLDRSSPKPALTIATPDDPMPEPDMGAGMNADMGGMAD